MNTRREQILGAAEGLAAEEGLSALSVRAVARRSGIGASTLRHYFPTQQDLYTAVLQASFDAQLEDRSIGDSTLPAVQRLVDCLSQFLPPADDQVQMLQHWLALHAAALGPESTTRAHDLLATFSTRANERIGRWLRVLAEEGTLRRADQDHALLLLNTVIDGLSLQFLTPGPEISVETAQAVLTEVVTGLIVAENH